MNCKTWPKSVQSKLTKLMKIFVRSSNMGTPRNQTLETNCRGVSPFDVRWQFMRVVYARSCLSSGSRSAFCWVTA
jgi:hypothetical protein